MHISTYLQTRLWWTLFTSFWYQDSQSSLCTVVCPGKRRAFITIWVLPACLECVRVCRRGMVPLAMPMSLEDNPGHWCSETNRAEMTCSLLTTNKKKEEIFCLRFSSAANANTSVSYVLLYGKITVIARYITLISAWTFLLNASLKVYEIAVKVN